MAYVNGNKPIVTNGLVYALDFGNTKSYTSGSNTARSIVFDPAGTTTVTGSTAIPTLTNGVLNFTGSQFVRRTGSLSVFDSQGSFTVQIVGKANTPGNLFSINTTSGNLASNVTPSSSVFGFNLSSGDFSRTYRGFTSSSLQHVTYRYSQGSIDIFLNGIPVTASQANTALTTTAISNALFINSGSNFFSGSVAQFYVYNRALSADEIYENYLVSAGRNSLPTIPKPYTQDENVYKFLQTTGITDLDTISAIDTFVSNLKSNGLWNKMTAIYPFLTTSTGSQAVNLKDPGVLGLGLTGSFSASSAGLTPSSSTSFIETQGVTTDTLYPTVNTASSHITLLSYDVPKTSSYPAAIVGGVGASGGAITFANGKVIHTFTSGSGSFIPLHASLTAVEVLVVAGGGGGGRGEGNNYGGGGGGAGGLIYSSSFSVTPLTTYTTVVGQGGASGSGSSTSGSNGENSQFESIITLGGGGGGAAGLSIPGNNGNIGGSGGGAGAGPGVPHIGGSGSIGQGNNGGNVTITVVGNGGAGGGGAGGNAPNRSTYGSFSPGGVGLVYSISGQPVTYSEGGIGGGFVENYGFNGLSNRGYGGSGTRFGTAGKGGSGVVIVSYPAISGQGPNSGFFITEDAISGSSNSEFSGGITGSGNIGFLTVSRTGSNSFLLRKNNDQTVINTPSSGAFNLDLYLGGASLAGATSSLGNSNTSISYASIGAGLTTTEVATYYNLVSQLQNNLKRQNTLLDNFSGAAAAYSLRRIGPSGYFGPAIRVRRDSDNTLRDIGFTSDGQLDTVGLLDFVGVTGSGFVQTWYDQSGNGRDATQGTTTRQPFIAISGSVTVRENKPVFQLDNATQKHLIAPTLNTLIGGNRLSFFTVVQDAGFTDMGANATSGNNGFMLRDFRTASPPGFWLPQLNTGNSPLIRDTIYTGSIKSVISIISNESSLTTYNRLDFKGSVAGNYTFNSTNNFLIGSIGGIGSFYSEARISEIILYNTDQTNNRLSISTNQFTHYSTSGSDPDYQSFITATGITQPTQSAALETLVSDLKSYGLWNKMKAIYPMITDKNNRLSDSQTLTNNWFQISSSLTVSSSAAPDGSNTGFLFKETATPTGSFTVVNNGASAYTFSGDVTGDNPTLTLERGVTYSFYLNASGHPFYIMTGSGAYTVDGQYNIGVTGQGTQVGTLTFTVPNNAPDTLAYVCQFHGSMAGTINVINNTAQHYITRTVVNDVISGSEYVVSFHGRYLNRPWMAVKTDAGVQGWFNVQTGTTGSFTGSNATVTAVSGGWYRCALYFTASEATAPRAAQFHLADADNSLSYAGNTASGSYIWGVQWENGNLLGPYRVTSNGFTTGSMLDQMKFNLKNPVDTDAGFRLTYNGNWNPGYSGTKPDGITAYGNAFIRNNAMSSSSIHLSAYSRTNATGTDGAIIGNSTAYYNLLRLKDSSNNFRGGINASTLNTVSNPNSTGYYIGLRTSPTSNRFFKNNILLGILTDNVVVDSNDPIYIGAIHRSGGATFYDNKEIAFATIGDGLTDYEAKALYWIVQKYQTTLGRQVY